MAHDQTARAPPPRPAAARIRSNRGPVARSSPPQPGRGGSDKSRSLFASLWATAFHFIALVAQKRAIDLFGVEIDIPCRHTTGLEMLLPTIHDTGDGA